MPNGVKALAPLLLVSLSCAGYQPFDSEGYLRQLYASRLGVERAGEAPVPFALDESARRFLATRVKPSGSELRRAQEIVDFIFNDLDLEYRLQPTRDAVETLRARQGNCLSFVNLFVAVARMQRLNAFYVEVRDQQGWSTARGAVLSQGHIVGGLRLGGELKIYDFLPNRPKSYRDLHPIDDLTAAAHYLNNLAAEALLAGDDETAAERARLAVAIAPSFDKGLNNLGVALARLGRGEEALAAYRRGLAAAPESEAILTNLVRLHQLLGQRDEVRDYLAALERLQVRNPFFYLYLGEQALAEGDFDEALRKMAEALRRDAELPEVHLGLVKLYAATGELAKARHHLARALRLDATNAEARRFAELLAGR